MNGNIAKILYHISIIESLGYNDINKSMRETNILDVANANNFNIYLHDFDNISSYQSEVLNRLFKLFYSEYFEIKANLTDYFTCEYHNYNENKKESVEFEIFTDDTLVSSIVKISPTQQYTFFDDISLPYRIEK